MFAKLEHNSYCIEVNFRGRNFRGSIGSENFTEKIFTDCLKPNISGCSMPQISWRKPWRMVLKPRNLRKFSPSKVSHYTVYYCGANVLHSKNESINIIPNLVWFQMSHSSFRAKYDIHSKNHGVWFSYSSSVWNVYYF